MAEIEMKFEFIVREVTLHSSEECCEIVPAVGIRLLDFPSVLVHPRTSQPLATGDTSFRFNRGKSCRFLASPKSLSARLVASSRPIQVSVINTLSSPASLVGTGLLRDPQLPATLEQWKESDQDGTAPGVRCFEGKYLVSLFNRAGTNVAVVTLKVRASWSFPLASSGKITADAKTKHLELVISETKEVSTTVTEALEDGSKYIKREAEGPLVASSNAATSRPESSSEEDYLPNSWLPLPLVYTGKERSSLIHRHHSSKANGSQNNSDVVVPISWAETQTHWTSLVKANANSQPLQYHLPTEPPCLHNTQATGCIFSQLPLLSTMYTELSLLRSLVDSTPLPVKLSIATTGVQTDLEEHGQDTPLLSNTLTPLNRLEEDKRVPALKAEKKGNSHPKRFVRECCLMHSSSPVSVSKSRSSTRPPHVHQKKKATQSKSQRVPAAEREIRKPSRAIETAGTQPQSHGPPKEHSNVDGQQTSSTHSPFQPVPQPLASTFQPGPSPEPSLEPLLESHLQSSFEPFPVEASQEQPLPADDTTSTKLNDSLPASVTLMLPSAEQRDNQLLNDYSHLLMQVSSSSEKSNHVEQPQQPVIIIPPPSSSSSSLSRMNSPEVEKPPRLVSQTLCSLAKSADSLDSTAAVLLPASQKVYLASSQSLDRAGLIGTAGSVTPALSTTPTSSQEETKLLPRCGVTSLPGDVLSNYSSVGSEDYSENFESEMNSCSNASI